MGQTTAVNQGWYGTASRTAFLWADWEHRTRNRVIDKSSDLPSGIESQRSRDLLITRQHERNLRCSYFLFPLLTLIYSSTRMRGEILGHTGGVQRLGPIYCLVIITKLFQDNI